MWRTDYINSLKLISVKYLYQTFEFKCAMNVIGAPLFQSICEPCLQYNIAMPLRCTDKTENLNTFGLSAKNLHVSRKTLNRYLCTVSSIL